MLLYLYFMLLPFIYFMLLYFHILISMVYIIIFIIYIFIIIIYISFIVNSITIVVYSMYSIYIRDETVENPHKIRWGCGKGMVQILVEFRSLYMDGEKVKNSHILAATTKNANLQ
jgi:hypothetical protein